MTDLDKHLQEILGNLKDEDRPVRDWKTEELPEAIAAIHSAYNQVLKDNYERGYSDGFTHRNKELWASGINNDEAKQ